MAVFQVFDAGFNENGNRRLIILVYDCNTGKVQKAYKSSNDKVIVELRSQGITQLKPVRYNNDVIKISDEFYELMIDEYFKKNLLEHT